MLPDEYKHAICIEHNSRELRYLSFLCYHRYEYYLHVADVFAAFDHPLQINLCFKLSSTSKTEMAEIYWSLT